MKSMSRLPAVKARTGYSTSKLYELMAEGRFPRPVKIGGRAVAWIDSEVDAHIDERIAERDAAAREAA